MREPLLISKWQCRDVNEDTSGLQRHERSDECIDIRGILDDIFGKMIGRTMQSKYSLFEGKTGQRDSRDKEQGLNRSRRVEKDNRQQRYTLGHLQWGKKVDWLEDLIDFIAPRCYALFHRHNSGLTSIVL